MLLPDHEHVYAFRRRLGDVTLTVLGNFSGQVQDVDLGADPGALVLGNYAEPAGSALRPWEARVHRS
jgi:oligo-1,6-glucosidase